MSPSTSTSNFTLPPTDRAKMLESEVADAGLMYMVASDWFHVADPIAQVPVCAWVGTLVKESWPPVVTMTSEEKVAVPVKVEAPVTAKAPPIVNESSVFRVLAERRKRFTSAVEPNTMPWVEPVSSRSIWRRPPVILKESPVAKSRRFAAPLESTMSEVPPAVEKEREPSSKVRRLSGAVVPMPTLLLVESMESVSVSKDRPFTPPERTRLVSLAYVWVLALKVRVSAKVSPRVVLPFTVRSPSVEMPPVAVTDSMLMVAPVTSPPAETVNLPRLMFRES